MEINDSLVPDKISGEQRLAVEKLPNVSRIDVVSTITIGRSGASVFVVDVYPEPSDGPYGRHILKIDEKGSGDSERKRHDAAYQTAIKPHMAKLVANSPKEKICTYVAVLYSLANDTLTDARPLYEYVEQNFTDAVKQLGNLAKALNRWNDRFTPRRECPHKLLTTLLGSLLEGSRSIPKIAQETLGIRDTYELRFEGSKYLLPNPVAYATQCNLWQGTQTILAPWGHVHYDLHSANIICPIKGKNKTPILIDFRKYEKDFITFYDYVYLEFDLLLRKMPPETDNAREEWLELGRHLATNLELPSNLPGSSNADIIKRLISPLRREVAQIAKQASQKDDFFLAYLLTGVVVGLNWFRKLNDSHQRNLVLLLAAQRLEVLLQRLGLKVPNRPIGNIPWLSQDRTALDLTIQANYERLRSEVASAFRERRLLLVLGSEVSRWLGLPSERALAEAVARRLSSSIRTSADEDDPACFNQLVKDNISNLDQIRILVAEYYKPESSLLEQAASKFLALAQVNWLAILDWSFSPLLGQRLAQYFSSQQKIDSVINIKDISKINLSNPLILPWIFLRGTIEEAKDLVLGNQEWRLRRGSDYPKKALEQLFTTGRQDSSTLAICLGCKGKILKELYELTQLAYHNSLQIWAIGTDVEQDEEAKTLQEEEELKLVSLSPEQFCDFLTHELPLPVSKLQLNEDRYVMELVGIELVPPEQGKTSNSSSSLVRRTANETEQIVELSVPEEKFASLKGYLEILYRGVELDTLSGRIPGGDFYRGYKSTWKDLAVGYDASRTITKDILNKTLLPDLKEQAPKRIRLLGEPGAGISTLAARLAWDVYKLYHLPVAIIRRVDSNLTGLTDAVSQFRDLVNRSFLLIAEDEYIRVDEADRLFEQLQSQLVPVVMLLVGQKHRNQLGESSVTAKRQRHFTLKDELDKQELLQLRQKLAPFVPESNQQKFRQLHDNSSLFINLLIAFEEEFVRLELMVRKLLEGISEEAKDLLTAIAFCDRYGHQPTPISFLATVTNYSSSQIINYLEPVTERLILFHKPKLSEINYSCRHELISLQILRELWGGGEENSWKLQLVDRTVMYLQRLGFEQAGNDWQRKFVATLVSGEFQRIKIRNREDYSVSRLMYDIETRDGRGRVFQIAAEQFPNEPHLLAQYGRFLYDEDTRFEESRKHLRNAFDLTKGKDANICHMLGMSYRRELQEHLQAIGKEKPNQSDCDYRNHLLEKAAQYFLESRELNRENQYGYTSHIECLISLIKQGFSQFSQDVPYSNRLRARADLRSWLDEAFGILDEAQVYLEFSQDTYLGSLQVRLTELRGNLSQAIEAYENLLDNSRKLNNSNDLQQRIDTNPIKRQLARCLYQRGIEKQNNVESKAHQQALKDFARAATYLEQLIQDQPTNPYHLGFWFQCARANPSVNKQILTERLEGYYARTKSLDGAFYLMCLFFIRGLEEKNPSAFDEYERYLKDCKALSASLTHRLYRREWLGPHFTLLPNRSVPFDSNKEEHITTGLLRITGTIKKVAADVHGDISIPPYGKLIYFPPKRHDQKFYKSDEGKSVTFNVAFTYDKPVAYNVRFA